MVTVGIDSRDCIIMVRTHTRITADKITKNRSSDQTIAENLFIPHFSSFSMFLFYRNFCALA